MKILPNKEVKGYNNYGAHLREKYYGQRVYKVIVDGGFSCPNSHYLAKYRYFKTKIRHKLHKLSRINL